MGGTGSEISLGIALAPDGSVYTTGSFQGTVDFDPGSGSAVLASAGNTTDIFVSKLDQLGNFLWASRIGSTGFDEGTGIDVGSDGAVSVTGSFEGTVDFDPGAGSAMLISGGLGDIFVLRLTDTGNHIWSRRIGSTSPDLGIGISLGPDGSVLTTGYFQGTVDFDPGTGSASLTSAGATDVFILKLNPLGDYVWARRFGGAGGGDFGLGIAVGQDGVVYTTAHSSEQQVLVRAQ